MKTLTIKHPQGDHNLFIGEGAIKLLSEKILSQIGSKHLVIITNKTVQKLYEKTVTANLNQLNARIDTIAIEDGEKFKSLETAQLIYKKLIEVQTNRESTLLALGGGVVGDLAGFVAATFMRGVDFVHLPTTLLAMVDSSIGGKTAVNLPEGKNLIGAFKAPLFILTDPLFLKTLPQNEIDYGLAEVIKSAIIGDKNLFSLLESGSSSFTEIITRAIQVKVSIVQEDPYETGMRAHLNLGHTFGHALEKLSHFQIPHGEAVARGLAAAARMARNRRQLTEDNCSRILNLLRSRNLPTDLLNFSAPEMWQAMKTDKKNGLNRLKFILPQDIGSVFIDETLEIGDLEKTIQN